MSVAYRLSTAGLFLLGVGGLAGGVWMMHLLGVGGWLLWVSSAIGALALLAIFAAAYWYGRPRGFGLSAEGLTIVWPGRQRLIVLGALGELRTVNDIELGRLRKQMGISNIYGTFGWFKSEYLQSMDVYITRREGMVMIRLLNRKPLLLTPAEPEAFMAAVQALAEAPQEE